MTLREYLEQAPGTFTSPNHPVPITGKQLLALLEEEPTPLPGSALDTEDVLNLEVEVVPQPGGDEWVYLAHGELEPDGEPYLIHQPR